MKMNEKERNAIVNEALFNLGTYFANDDRGFFVDCEGMDDVAIALIEEIWEPETELVTTITLGLVAFNTDEDAENLDYMMETILDFISAHGEVRDWLISILRENRLESLHETAYEISKYEYFDTEEERKKALEPLEKRIEELNAEAETMKEAWDSFKKFKYGDKNFDWFL